MKKPVATPSVAISGADRIELMQTFVRIVQAGSLSAAAAQLGTTQPTVSRRLQLLEKSLGLRLLQRSTHAMKLTEDGERCYLRALELISGWDAFETDMRSPHMDVQGSLRVIVPHAFGQKVLIGPLTEFMQRHPGVSVEWLLHDKDVDFIGQGIDCAIHVGQVTDPSLVAIKLAEISRIVVAAPSMLANFSAPQHARDLSILPWMAIPTLYRREISLAHAATGELCNVPIQPRLSSDNLFALSELAIKGMGLCLCSEWLVRPLLASGKLVRVLPEWQATPIPISLVYPYAQIYPARLRHFIDIMRDSLPKAMSSATD